MKNPTEDLPLTAKPLDVINYMRQLKLSQVLRQLGLENIKQDGFYEDFIRFLNRASEQ